MSRIELEVIERRRKERLSVRREVVELTQDLRDRDLDVIAMIDGSAPADG